MRIREDVRATLFPPSSIGGVFIDAGKKLAETPALT
jgi:hypothetical protein